MARIVTFISKDTCVRNISNVLKGICIDTWKRTALDLNISYTLEIVEEWFDMFTYLKEDRADVIVQKTNAGMMTELQRQR